MTKETLIPNAQSPWCLTADLRNRTGRSADLPACSNSGKFHSSAKSCNPHFFHVAADWKVRAPLLNPPCFVLSAFGIRDSSFFSHYGLGISHFHVGLTLR